MYDKLKKRLKKKIWVISTIILLAYLVTLAFNLYAWATLLPFIIPTSILTLGIPIYDIIKHVNANSINDVNNITIEECPNIDEKVANEGDLLKEDYILPQDNDINLYLDDKPKIKTKGTINYY